MIALYLACPQSKCPKAPVASAPSTPLVETPQPRSLSVSAVPEIPVDAVHGGVPQKAAPLHGRDSHPPKPGDGRIDGNVSSHNPVGSGGSQITSVQPTVQHAGVRGSTALIVPDTAPSPHSTPLPPASSAGSAPSSFNNQPSYFSPYARPPHLREGFTVLCFIFVNLRAGIDYGFF